MWHFIHEIAGEMNSTNIEIGIVDKDMAFRLLKPSEIKDYLAEVEW